MTFFWERKLQPFSHIENFPLFIFSHHKKSSPPKYFHPFQIFDYSSIFAAPLKVPQGRTALPLPTPLGEGDGGRPNADTFGPGEGVKNWQNLADVF